MEHDGLLETARQIADLVMQDWQALGGDTASLDVWLQAGEVCIWVNGGGTIPSAYGDSRQELAVDVAAYVHSELIDHAYRVLLTCPLHRAGLPPRGVVPPWRSRRTATRRLQHD